MIYYLATRAHAYTIDFYLKHEGEGLKPRIRRLAYEDLFRMEKIPGGAYIFSDIERLDHRQAEQASAIWQSLSRLGSAVRLLNHPTRSMKRYELLRELYERGINNFDVYRLTEARRPRRFPVFIRDENEHGLIHSGLLDSQQALDDDTKKILSSGSMRENKLIVEYCRTSDTAGIFRKYSSFMVGGNLVPRHVFFSSQWDVRHSLNTCLDAGKLGEEKRYVEGNSHTDLLKEVFELARIDYGRVDYSLLDGKPQIWEINTNPSIFSLNNAIDGPRAEVLKIFADRLEKEFTALDTLGPVKQWASIQWKKTRPAYPPPFFEPKVLASLPAAKKFVRPVFRLLPLSARSAFKRMLKLK